VTSVLGFSCTLPAWVSDIADFERAYGTDSDKMDLVIALAMNNATRNTGGPFGAAIFDAESHRLIAPGVNLVVPASNPTAHAEIVAIAIAGSRLGRYDLGDEGASPSVLATSVEPCAMCLGATPWSGVSSLLVGARDADARAIGFDEGTKPDDWVGVLTGRGISVTLDVQREGAVAVLDTYLALGGHIYNADGEGNDA
jgi:tRNA(Arg) A34 adenosine deaminase TadA